MSLDGEVTMQVRFYVDIPAPCYDGYEEDLTARTKPGGKDVSARRFAFDLELPKGFEGDCLTTATEPIESVEGDRPMQERS